MRCGHFLPPPYLLCNRLESRWQSVAHRHSDLDTRLGGGGLHPPPHPLQGTGELSSQGLAEEWARDLPARSPRVPPH